jgi:ribosomal protein S25
MKSNFFKNNFYSRQYDCFREGMNFYQKANTGILITNVDRERELIKKNKDNVLDLIKKQKTVYLTEIMDTFDLNVVVAKRILNELEQEGKIKINA